MEILGGDVIVSSSLSEKEAGCSCLVVFVQKNTGVWERAGEAGTCSVLSA